MKQPEKKRVEEIFEERKSKVLSLEHKLSLLKDEVDLANRKMSASGLKRGENFAEYASYRKKLDKTLASITKKLVEAKEELKKAEERLNSNNL